MEESASFGSLQGYDNFTVLWSLILINEGILTWHFLDTGPFIIFTLFTRKVERLGVGFLWLCVNWVPKRTNF